jgi:hypothetical protein
VITGKIRNLHYEEIKRDERDNIKNKKEIICPDIILLNVEDIVSVKEFYLPKVLEKAPF